MNRLVFWLLLIAASLASLIVLAAAITYFAMVSNIRHIEVTRSELGERRPVKASPGAVNILLVGSDRREGNDGALLGERTDTIMLVHMPADRHDLTIISFPRDLRVQLPGCISRSGFAGQRAQRAIINSSFNAGGIGCTWKTIEALTGIYIDHFVIIDFTGFKMLVDALGGVDVCIPEPIHDTYIPLDLPSGFQLLDGERALGYVRVRHGLSNGTDIGRIQRQQRFLSALAKKAMSAGILLNPGRLFPILNAASKSVTTDPDLTPGQMIELALAMRAISTENIRFLTTPWRDSINFPGRVELLEGPAKRLFRSIAEEQPFNQNDLKKSEPAITPPAEQKNAPAPSPTAIPPALCP